jgi:hypothetical protein
VDILSTDKCVEGRGESGDASGPVWGREGGRDRYRGDAERRGASACVLDENVESCGGGVGGMMVVLDREWEWEYEVGVGVSGPAEDRPTSATRPAWRRTLLLDIKDGGRFEGKISGGTRTFLL